MTPEALWLGIGIFGCSLALVVLLLGAWEWLMDRTSQWMAGIGWWE